jgi:hypothetical protein
MPTAITDKRLQSPSEKSLKALKQLTLSVFKKRKIISGFLDYRPQCSILGYSEIQHDIAKRAAYGHNVLDYACLLHCWFTHSLLYDYRTGGTLKRFLQQGSVSLSHSPFSQDQHDDPAHFPHFEINELTNVANIDPITQHQYGQATFFTAMDHPAENLRSYAHSLVSLLFAVLNSAFPREAFRLGTPNFPVPLVPCPPPLIPRTLNQPVGNTESDLSSGNSEVKFYALASTLTDEDFQRMRVFFSSDVISHATSLWNFCCTFDDDTFSKLDKKYIGDTACDNPTLKQIIEHVHLFAQCVFREKNANVTGSGESLTVMKYLSMQLNKSRTKSGEFLILITALTLSLSLSLSFSLSFICMCNATFQFHSHARSTQLTCPNTVYASQYNRSFTN